MYLDSDDITIIQADMQASVYAIQSGKNKADEGLCRELYEDFSKNDGNSPVVFHEDVDVLNFSRIEDISNIYRPEKANELVGRCYFFGKDIDMILCISYLKDGQLLPNAQNKFIVVSVSKAISPETEFLLKDLSNVFFIKLADNGKFIVNESIF